VVKVDNFDCQRTAKKSEGQREEKDSWAVGDVTESSAPTRTSKAGGQLFDDRSCITHRC